MEFVCGACNALDERTGFLPPGEEYTTHVSQLNSLGVLVAKNSDNLLFVERVAPGSWASQMGFKPGDRIICKSRKDDKDEVGPLTELDLVSLGEPTPRNIRLPDSLASVFAEPEVSMEGIAYIQIAGFTKSTLQELDKALIDLKMRGMQALVLDLRGNPGGLFPVAVQMAERFLPEGIIVSTQGQSSRTFESHSGMSALNMPLFVLVDNDTASAAEVLAGAERKSPRQADRAADLRQGNDSDGDAVDRRGRRPHHVGPILHTARPTVQWRRRHAGHARKRAAARGRRRASPRCPLDASIN